jgi:hypothetical protein
LFVVGLPRSGTTLAHRCLAAHRDTFTTFTLWELLIAPALCEKYLVRGASRVDRRFGRPIGRLVDRFERSLFGSLDAVHPTTLRSPEEDYLGLLAFGGCFLEVLAHPHRTSVWRLGHFSRRLSRGEQMRLVKRYRELVRRHLYFRGGDRHLLSKNPSFTSWMPALAEAFPDARFVGLRRDPTEALPSQLSSLREGLRFFGHDVSDPRIVRGFLFLLVHYRDELDRAAEALSESRFCGTDYRDLTADPIDWTARCLARLGYATTAEDRLRLERESRGARGYRSRHQYSAEAFGLTARQIRRAFHRRLQPGEAAGGLGGNEDVSSDLYSCPS